MHFEKYQWISLAYATFFIIMDVLWLYRVNNAVNKPIKKIIIRKLLSKYDNVEKLYRAYKELSTEEFKLAKLHLKTKEYDFSFAQQAIDLTIKLLFTIGVASIGVIITVSSSLLSFLKDNNQLQKNPDNKITENVSGIIKLFSEGVNVYMLIFWCSLMLLIASITHLFLTSKRKSLQKMHLTIIEEIVEEKKEEKKVTPPVATPDQSQSAS